MKDMIQKIKETANKVYQKFSQPQYNLAFKIFLILLLFLWTFNLATRRFRQEYLQLRVGDIAPYDIRVDSDVEYIDEFSTRQKIENASSRVLPLFKLRMDIAQEKTENMDDIFDEIEEMEDVQISGDEITKRIHSLVKVDKETLDMIIRFHRVNNFRTKARAILDYIFKQGYSSVSKEEVKKLSVENEIMKIQKLDTGEEINIKSSVEDIYYSASEAAREVTKKLFPQLRWDKSKALSVFTEKYLSPNLFYEQIRTEEIMKEEIKMIEPVKKRLKKGQIIVRYGEEISEQQFRKLSGLRKYTRQSNYNMILGYFFLLFLLFLLSGIVFFGYGGKWVKQDKYYLFLITFLFVMATLNYFFPNTMRLFPVRLEKSLLIPIGGIAILLTSFTSPVMAYVLVLFISLISNFIIGFEFLDFLIMFLIGGFIVLISSKIQKRVYTWLIGLIISFLYFIIILTIAQVNNYTQPQFVNSVLAGFLNGVISVIISTGFLPLFEYIFNLLTDFRLLELSDLNLPIMKKLLIEAPGTYHHSIMVANLAESAALSIGADPLLARVGAYYHDIGKIENPDYFIENQSSDESKHDKIKPSISSSVVKAHVKYGVEMALNLRIPSEIIEIIKEHHGTTVISYFYKKALEDASEDDRANIVANFQYKGPKPQSKEAAIIMLADSVEAASRLLKKPSHPRLVGMVKEIINNRFMEGELNECPLTLVDMNKIAQSFIQVLSGRFHSRIEYPEKEEIEKLEKNGSKHRK
ncbi:MAG: HDIG domain-containing protein [Spirochaetes bacterium]|nr:HDIG domain-containing protein [Spirochaetota bacterium]